MDGLDNDNKLSSTIEFFMTSEQQRVISQLLPKGYSLQFASKPARQKSNNFALFSPLDASDLQMRGSNGQFATNSRGQRQSKQAHSAKFSENYDNSFDQNGAIKRDPSIMQQQYTQMQEQQSQQLQQLQYQTMQQEDQQQIMQSQQQYQMHYPQPKLQQRKSNSKAPQYPAGNQQQLTNNMMQQQLNGQQLILPPMSQTKRRTSEKSQKRRSDGSRSGKGYGGDALGGLGMEVEEQKKCLSVLTALQRHKMAVPFLRPVDPIKQECADYLMVIRDPMDLGTVERNLRSLQYQSPTQFAADVRKIWNNSYLYNSRDSQIYQMTLEMDRFFEQKFKETEHSNAFGSQEVKNIPYLVQILAQAMQGKTKNPANQAPVQRASAPSKKPKSAPSKMDIPMTMQEKKNLGQNILQLPPDYLRGIWEIVQSDSDQHVDDKVMEFDIDALSVRKTRELEQYVKQKMANLSKKLSKKQSKVSDKAEAAESKLLQQQQLFCNDDETSGTRNDTLIVQDHIYPEMTQNTATLTQQYQVPMNSNLFGMDSTNLQNIGGYQTANLPMEYGQSSNGAQEGNVTGQLDFSMQNSNVQGNTAGAPNETNDQDSESSFMSGDSDSQNY